MPVWLLKLVIGHRDVPVQHKILSAYNLNKQSLYMTLPFQHTSTKYFLGLMSLVVFLCVSLWQSSHVHHQHGSADTGLTFGHISCVCGLPDGQRGDAESHGEHSHDAPDKTAHLYKHQTSWKTFRGKADSDSKLKMPAVLCARDTVIPTKKSSTIRTPSAMGGIGAWFDGRPPARAPPVIYSLV
jgi:hypothetical protein